MPAKDLERGSTPKLIPSQKTLPHNMGNIQYAEQLNKGFPALESKPGFSSASSCYVDECSPSPAFSPYDVLPLIPAEGGISFFSLVGRVWELCDPQLTHEDVRQAVYALVRLEDLQVLPGYDGDLRIMHSDRSLCALQILRK